MATAFEHDPGRVAQRQPAGRRRDGRAAGLRLRGGGGSARRCACAARGGLVPHRARRGRMVRRAGSIFTNLASADPGSGARPWSRTSQRAPRPAACPTGGSLELYDGGKVIARRSVMVRFGSERALDGTRHRDDDVVARRAGRCGPARATGLSAGLVSPDGESGALAVHLTQRVAVADRSAMLEAVLRPTLGSSERGRLRRGPTAERHVHWTSWNRRRGTEQSRGQGGARRHRKRAHGSVVIGIVFGPERGSTCRRRAGLCSTR